MSLTRRQFVKVASAVVAGAMLPAVAAAEPLKFHPDAFAFTMEPFCVGDIFTIEGYFALNPVTRTPTTHLAYFICSEVGATGDLKGYPARFVPISASDPRVRQLRTVA